MDKSNDAEVKAGMKAGVKVRMVIANLCRMVLAATFLFSGFVKADDPFGMTYKFEDYLAAFGLGGLLPELFLLCCAVMLALFEFTLGVNILLCIARKATARVTLAFMWAMTALTLYIALADPVSDCGCFGDAIVLSNTATLAKNVVLLACAVALKRFGSLQLDVVPRSIKSMATPVSLVGVVVCAAYCIVCLPLVDFRPYKVGTDLRAAIESAQPRYEVRIVYERGGETIELADSDDDPDSTWRYVETRRIELPAAKGAEVLDFYAENADGEDVTGDILYADGCVLLLTVPNLLDADEGCTDKVNETFDRAVEHGVPFYCLTGSADAAAHTYWREHTGAEYDFCIADERLLKTIVRGNPGLVMMRDGVIVAKWSNHNLPGNIAELFD